MTDQPQRQTPSAVLMVRPAGFGFNEETAGTNVFQTRDPDATDDQLQVLAEQEFDGLVTVLRDADVDVIVIQDTPEPRTPDAVFPNNWVSFHEDGKVILYPMFAPVRRAERRRDVIETLETTYGFEVSQVVDLTPHEEKGKFLEGTGSLIFDYPNRCSYANLSPRTDRDVRGELTGLLGHDLVTFHATDAQGIDVYHTNVVMSIGEKFVVISADAIDDPTERTAVLDRLRSTGRELVLIDRDQMGHFAGNVLEVENREGTKVLVMSSQARASLDASQINALGKHARIVSAPIPTIERVEGGSARCMLAGVHLPRRRVLD